MNEFDHYKCTPAEMRRTYLWEEQVDNNEEEAVAGDEHEVELPPDAAEGDGGYLAEGEGHGVGEEEAHRHSRSADLGRQDFRRVGVWRGRECRAERVDVDHDERNARSAPTCVPQMLGMIKGTCDER